MKNALIFILIIILLVANSTAKKEEVYVDYRIEPVLERFQDLMEENDIEVDYSKVTAYEVMSLGDNLLGVYNPENGNLYIDSKLTLPFSAYLTTAKEDIPSLMQDYALVVLAHEIMHSQGVLHVTDDPESIMATSDVLIVDNIKKIGAEELILRTYRKMAYLQAVYPTVNQNTDSISPE